MQVGQNEKGIAKLKQIAGFPQKSFYCVNQDSKLLILKVSLDRMRDL